ncbi:hypothetical protein CR513_26179, partial [Mucuna pruriens]
MDYFTKWIAIVSLAAIITQKAKQKGRGLSKHPLSVPLHLTDYHRQNPFRLAFETNTMIPVEVSKPSIRQNDFNLDENSNTIQIDLDLVEEVKEQAYI